MSKRALSVTVFVTGAAVLALEILASRYMLPAFGTSIFIWGAVLSITLVSLALGYEWGGQLADRLSEPDKRLVRHVLLAAGWIAALPLWGTPFVRFGIWTGPLAGPIVVTIVLFAVPLILLATMVPLAFGCVLKSRGDAPGRTLGFLFAVSTAGSVFGALATAYLAVPFVGLSRSFFLISALLLAVVVGRVLRGTGTNTANVILIVLVASELTPRTLRGAPEYVEGIYHLFRTDTRYAQMDVLQDERDGSRILLLDGASQNWVSGEDWSESQFDYIPRILHHIGRYRGPEGKALVLGLGAGTLVRQLHRTGFDVEVVEIDPKVYAVAQEFFALPAQAARFHFGDARPFLEKAAKQGKKFDVIIVDVTGGGHHPEHIYNREAYVDMRELLMRDGVVIANMVVFTKPPHNRAARYSAATLASVFPSAEALDLYPSAAPGELSQMLLFGSFLPSLRPPTRGQGAPMKIEAGLRPLTDDWNPLPLWSIDPNAKWHSNIREWFGDAAYLR